MISQAEYETLRGQYPTLDTMARLKLPLTRSGYLAVMYGAEVPNPIPHEEQSYLPPHFRDSGDGPVSPETPEE